MFLHDYIMFPEFLEKPVLVYNICNKSVKKSVNHLKLKSLYYLYMSHNDWDYHRLLQYAILNYVI